MASPTHTLDPRPPALRADDLTWWCMALLVLLTLGLRTIAGPEVWMHLSAGRAAAHFGPLAIDPFSSTLPPDTVWRQTTWLYDLLVYRIWVLAGPPAVILLHAAAAAGGFLFLSLAVRRHAAPGVIAPALLLAAWLSAPLLTVRPAVLCLFLFGLAVWLITAPRPTRGRMISLFLLTVLWANLHPSFLLVLLLAAARAIETANAHRRTGHGSWTAPGTLPVRMTALAATLPLAALLNPFGVHVYTEAFALLRPDAALTVEYISPFQASFLPHPLRHLSTVALVVIAGVFIFRRAALPMAFSATGALGAFLMVRSPHQLEWAAALAFPLLVIGLNEAAARIGAISARGNLPHGRLRGLASATLGFLLVLSLVGILSNRYYARSGSAATFGLGVNPDIVPVATVAELTDRMEPSARLLHLARDAGFLLWRMPERRVLIDPRTHLYGVPFYRQLATDLAGQPGVGPNLIERIDPDVMLLNAAWSGAGPAAAHWIDTGRYALAFHDGSSVLLVRPTSGFREWLEDPELAARGDRLITRAAAAYRERLAHPWVHPGNSVRLIGAAGMYQALGRYADALPLLQLVNQGSPAFVAAWVNRGIAELALGDPEAASRSLDHAVRLAPAAFTAQCWRMRAHARAGREDLAATLRATLYAQQPLRLLEFEKMPDPVPLPASPNTEVK